MTNAKQLKFDDLRVLVIGDVMLDRYWHGPVSRISPEAPVPVLKVSQVEDRPGGAGNVALNIAALGAKVTLMGAIGDDEVGRALAATLAAAGVDNALQVNTHHPTITKLRMLSQRQQLLRCDFEQDLSQAIDKSQFMSTYERELKNCDVVVLSDYAKGTLYQSQDFIRAAKAADKPILVDPKSQDFSDYAGATLLTPNLKEFELAVGEHNLNEKMLLQHAKSLRAHHDLAAMIVTRGEQGMTLVEASGKETHVPTQAREVYDVTGAGDTVIATLALGIARGLSLVEAMSLANVAAGIVVGKLGAATVSLPELNAACYADGEAVHGVMTEAQLMLVVAAARARGERIVMTNGCFDILHAGHVHYLSLARKQGDRLLVAVNSDESVRKIKGPSRPVNTLMRRMLVLAGMTAVDWVIPFEEDTPCRLLEKIKPDCLVKGGDYQADEVVGADIVKKYGGKVKVLGLVEGLSTTATINQLQQSDDSKNG